jgi:RNA polymerase sigma-70 factor, ECF subfamily
VAVNTAATKPVSTIVRLPEFRALFAAEFGFVARALLRLGVREADVMDVAQEVFVAVHRELAQFDAQQSLKSWLYGFARRFAANYRR